MTTRGVSRLGAAVLALAALAAVGAMASAGGATWAGVVAGALVGALLAAWFCTVVSASAARDGDSGHVGDLPLPTGREEGRTGPVDLRPAPPVEAHKPLAVVPTRPVYDDDERHEARERIKALLADDALQMVLQPIFDTRSGELAGAEALARFTTPTGEGPDHWFRQAAIAGLGVDLERAALRKALELLVEIPRPAFLAVNVSAATLLSDGLRNDLEGVPPGRLVLELTEHTPVEDYGRLYAAVIRLRTRGHVLAIDDAGAAAATLRHVVRLNPQILKLDVSLTAKLHVDPVRHSLVAALIDFANRNGMRIVAEGVETVEELRALKELEVHAVQGYYLARPAPPPLLREAPTLRRHVVDVA